MKRTVILIAVLIILSALLLIYALSAKPTKKRRAVVVSPTASAMPSPAADSSLVLTPENISLTSTDSATVDVNIDTGYNQITGVQLEIGYDPKAIFLTEVKPGTFLPSPNILLNNNDRSLGRLSYALVLSPSQSPVSGSGKIAVLRVRKNPDYVGSGQTKLSLLPKSLVSALGVDGSVLRDINSTTIITLNSVSVIVPSITQPAVTNNQDIFVTP